MKLDKNTADYLSRQRWCNFKEEIRLKQIKDIEFTSVPFDDDNKMLTIGRIRFLDENNLPSRNFMMPLALAEQDDTDTLVLNGKVYTDALQRPDWWQKMNELFRQKNNSIIFPNGWRLECSEFGDAQFLEQQRFANSRPLNVQQSNTTLSVGDDLIAFKLERMLEFSQKKNPEFEMNEKLMRENSSVMPKTYGYLILHNPQNNTMASSGIIQEFIVNQGDFWNYSLAYLKQRLNKGYLQQRSLTAEENPHFISLMRDLGKKTEEMSECLSRPDTNPAFTPEPVDERFIHTYQKQLEFLHIKTRNTIQNNLENLPQETKNKASVLLQNWNELLNSYIDVTIGKIKKNMNGGYSLVRVHGDFHLGQVLVTQNNELKFIDFAGEPAASFKERAQKHISVRDLAGMYRSVKGYLGNVAVEEFVADAPDEASAKARRSYAEKAIRPLIDESARLVLNGHSLKEPWLGLEVLRKNLYEVNYEVTYRPQMAYVAINGLASMLSPDKNIPENIISQKLSSKSETK